MIVTVVIPSAMTIEEALQKHTEELMAIPGVVGVGQGLCDRTPCIKVLVTEKTPEIEKSISDSLEGYRVEITVSGRIEAEPKNSR